MLNQFVTPDLLPAAPELFLAAMASLLLLVDVFLKGSKRTLTFVLTQLILLGTALIVQSTSTGEVTYTFSRMFVDDMMADLLKLLLLLSVVVVLLYSRDYVQARKSLAVGEFYILTLFATLGMMVMVSANHFLTVYLGLELLSLSLYAMVALDRDSVVSTEAAMKYFVLGALASGLLLYGMSMIYGATGNLEITAVSAALFTGNVNVVLLVFGVVFLVAGLAFKLGVVPFHMWVPDVYHGSPTAVTLLIGSAPKFAAFAITMRLLVSGMFMIAEGWQSMLMILAVLSVIIGNVVAVAQTNIKRMLAYSAISHMGFMLFGISSAVVGGDPRFALDAYSSSMFYVVAYVLMSMAGFGAILLLSRAGFEADQLEDFKGLNKRSPWFAAMMMFVMFSMAGIPFFIGFFAKFAVLQAVVAAGYVGLAIVAVMFSLVGAFYYLRVVKVMYFDQPDTDAPITASTDMQILLSVNALAIAVLGLFPDSLIGMCKVALARSLL
jgi:NADH-quinone oxidoreductase subunit N